MRKILVVDDELSALKMLTLALKVEGYDVETATSGEAALELAVRYRPDLILLDVMMPKMDGYEVCRRLRRMLDFAEVPVLFLSARGQVEDKVQGLRAGGDSYVTKPISPQELIARIGALLGSYASRELIGYGAALFGSKAGVGTTTIAVNLALALQMRAQESVVLIDGHSDGGDVGVFLNLVHSHHAGQLMDSVDQLDPGILNDVLLEHASGLQVLMAPSEPSASPLISPSSWERIMGVLCQMANYVIFDGPPLRSVDWMPVLDLVDDVYLITTPEITAMKRLAVSGGVAKSRRRVPANVHVLLNRYAEQSGFSMGAIARTLGADIHTCVDDVGPLNTFAINRGVPLMLSDKRSSLSRAVDNLAGEILDKHRSAAADEKREGSSRGLRRFLPSR